MQRAWFLNGLCINCFTFAHSNILIIFWCLLLSIQDFCVQRAWFLTDLHIRHCIMLIYWSFLLSVTIKSGLLCAKSKFPFRTVHSLFHTAHSNVMVILRYLLYGYTGCRKHINPDFVYSVSRFGKLLPEEHNFPKVPRHSLVPHLSCILRSK